MSDEVTLADVPVQNDDTAAREIDEVVYVVNPATSELHCFNEVGSRIYSLIDGVRTVAEIADAIAAEYDVDEDTARADIVEFLTVLRAKGLVRS